MKPVKIITNIEDVGANISAKPRISGDFVEISL